jgi:hypothetical protein
MAGLFEYYFQCVTLSGENVIIQEMITPNEKKNVFIPPEDDINVIIPPEDYMYQ